MQHVVCAVDSHELLILLSARVDHEAQILAQGSRGDGGFVRQTAHCNGKEDEFNNNEIINFSEVALWLHSEIYCTDSSNALGCN